LSFALEACLHGCLATSTLEEGRGLISKAAETALIGTLAIKLLWLCLLAPTLIYMICKVKK
uniref:Uncharacterized protein n=1 Tax=Aegilops tauschii subsp. strangulata TaxID=200361 RepID=A0A453BPW3_AEGTS